MKRKPNAFSAGCTAKNLIMLAGGRGYSQANAKPMTHAIPSVLYPCRHQGKARFIAWGKWPTFAFIRHGTIHNKQKAKACYVSTMPVMLKFQSHYRKRSPGW
jgi:hypothetical protein